MDERCPHGREVDVRDATDVPEARAGVQVDRQLAERQEMADGAVVVCDVDALGKAAKFSTAIVAENARPVLPTRNGVQARAAQRHRQVERDQEFAKQDRHGEESVPSLGSRRARSGTFAAFSITGCRKVRQVDFSKHSDDGIFADNRDQPGIAMRSTTPSLRTTMSSPVLRHV